MSFPIKVLQFANLINRYDFIDNMINFADPAKFEMSVCVRSEESNIARPQFPEKTKYVLLPGNSRKDLLQTAWKLSKILREWKIDILHTHHYDQALIGYLATRIYSKTKLIVGRHYSDSMYRLPSKSKQKIFLNIENIVNRGAARIIVPSILIRNLLTEQQKIDASKIDIVPYGFPDEKFPVISESEIEKFRNENNLNGKIVLCTIGRIDGQKGHDDLILALKIIKEKIHNIHLLVIGEGPQRFEIEKLVKGNYLEQYISFLGWRKDVVKIIKAADIVVHPSLQEAFSSVMCEALWLGKALIISDVGGAMDIICNGENGYIVPKSNIPVLTQTIEMLCNNVVLRTRIAENGKLYAQQNLSIKKVIKRYESSYLLTLSES